MAGPASLYNQPADVLASLLGGPVGSNQLPTFAAAVQLDTYFPVHQINGVNATSATCAVTGGLARVGLLVVICKAAGGTVTYTFGSGFKVTGTVAPTVGTTIALLFIGDGTNFFEVARSASAITG